MNFEDIIKAINKKPYYQDDAVVIYHADCREILPLIPDKSIDLVLTDPPYGKNADKGTHGFGNAQNRRYVGNWDNEIPNEDVFNSMFRVGKNSIIFGGNYFAQMLIPSKCWIVWDKKGDIAFQNPFADCELLYTTFTKPIKKYVFKQQGFITDSNDTREHPTQKPSELVRQIMIDFGGDSILDPFLGSGTTAYCAKKLGRKCIGIEIEEKYCEIAAKRCCQTVMSLGI